MNPRMLKQHFVQSCALFGSMRKEEALKIVNQICVEYESETLNCSSFNKFIEDVNEELNCYDHDIAVIKYPISNEEILVFRTINSNKIRFLNSLTEQDRNYFRLIIMTIAASENYGISEIRTVNLTSLLQDKTLPKNRAESLLKNWKRLGYFYESDQILYLGPRMIVEFETFLLQHFPDNITECTLCKKIVLWDSACKDCKTKFHSNCIRKYLIQSSNCPACQNIWNSSLV